MFFLNTIMAFLALILAPVNVNTAEGVATVSYEPGAAYAVVSVVAGDTLVEERVPAASVEPLVGETEGKTILVVEFHYEDGEVVVDKYTSTTTTDGQGSSCCINYAAATRSSAAPAATATTVTTSRIGHTPAGWPIVRPWMLKASTVL